MKPSDNGRFIKSRHKYGRWLWLCTDCSNRTIWRQNRRGEESHYEKIVREALQAVFPHLGIKAEYKVGPYLFDFAVTDLRLLLEIDPHGTHGSVGRKIRDWKKSKVAKEKGWKLVRLVPYPPRQLPQRAVQAVRDYYESLFTGNSRERPSPKNSSRERNAVDYVVSRWTHLFHYLYGFHPKFQPGDVKDLEDFFEDNPDTIPERLINIFWYAWEDAKKKPKNFPICRGAISISYFVNHLNGIMDELGFGKNYLLK